MITKELMQQWSNEWWSTEHHQGVTLPTYQCQRAAAYGTDVMKERCAAIADNERKGYVQYQVYQAAAGCVAVMDAIKELK